MEGNSELLRAQLQLVQFRRAMEWRRQFRPHDLYQPHGKGQLAFHQSSHIIRFLCPGNGWGKTIAAGNEVQAWQLHRNRWRKTPDRPISAKWFCPKQDQFEDGIRPYLVEKCFGKPPYGPRWTKGKFVWPDGGELIPASTKSSWTTHQGVPLDLAIFDEHFPHALFLEIYLRGRDTRKTELVIGATMTQGMTWEYSDLYKPWMEHHRMLGLDETSAMKAQAHPDIFCWPKGGIDDNPSADDVDRRRYRNAPFANEKERLVRLGGGFQDWSGENVFASDGVAWLREQQTKLGEGLCENGVLVPLAA